MCRPSYYGLVLDINKDDEERLLLKVLTPEAIIDFVDVFIKRFSEEELLKITKYNTIVMYHNHSKIHHPAIELNVEYLSTFDDIKDYAVGKLIGIPTNDDNLINLNNYVDDLSCINNLIKNINELSLFYKCLWFDKFACSSKR